MTPVPLWWRCPRFRSQVTRSLPFPLCFMPGGADDENVCVNENAISRVVLIELMTARVVVRVTGHWVNELGAVW